MSVIKLSGCGNPALHNLARRIHELIDEFIEENDEAEIASLTGTLFGIAMAYWLVSYQGDINDS